MRRGLIYPNFRLIGIIFCTLIVGSLPSLRAEASDFDQDREEFRHMMATLNTASPLDGAGSHGAWGSDTGLGIIHTSTRRSPIFRRNFYQEYGETAPADQPLVLPRLTIVKGLNFPLDLGVSFATASSGRVQHLGTHAKWTIYEDFKRPSVALRGSWATLRGLQGAAMQSVGGDLLVGLDMGSYFNVYISSGLHQHHSRIEVDSEVMTLYLTDFNAGLDEHESVQSRQSRVHAVGLRLTLLAPFVKCSFEWQKHPDAQTQAFLAKMSLGT